MFSCLDQFSCLPIQISASTQQPKIPQGQSVRGPLSVLPNPVSLPGKYFDFVSPFQGTLCSTLICHLTLNLKVKWISSLRQTNFSSVFTILEYSRLHSTYALKSVINNPKTLKIVVGGGLAIVIYERVSLEFTVYT